MRNGTTSARGRFVGCWHNVGPASASDVNLNMTKGPLHHHNTDLDRIIYTPLASYRVGPMEGGTGYYGGIDLSVDQPDRRGISVNYRSIGTNVSGIPRGVECYAL